MKRPRGMGAVFQRGRIWWFRRRPGEKPESSHSTVKKDAEDMLKARLLAQPQRVEPGGVDVARTTYAALEAMVLADLRANRRRSLANVEKYRLPHLRRFFGGMLAASIRYDVVSSYVASRLERAAPATVSYEVKLLRRMFRIARRAGRVGELPEFPTVAVGDNARKGFCSPEEIDAVIEHLPEHAQPIVRCLYLTGWRTREVLALEWRRVDLEAGVIRLDARDSKSGRPRLFPFAQLPELAELIHAQRACVAALERERGRIVPWVFPLEGEALKSFRSAWRTAVRKAGLPGLRPHDLRRSAARNLVRAGVSEGVVMKLCGWSTRSMFDRYNVVDERDLAEGVGRLRAFLAARPALSRAAKQRDPAL